MHAKFSSSISAMESRLGGHLQSASVAIAAGAEARIAQWQQE